MEVRLNKRAQKQLQATPVHIQRKFEYWCDLLDTMGLLGARKYKGFHDEPLKGKRRGQRSVRLSHAYRLIYIELDRGQYEIIEVIEVTKHEY